MKLWHKHNNNIWFRWKLGKLVIEHIGHETNYKMPPRFWTDVLWDGICIIKIGKYV